MQRGCVWRTTGASVTAEADVGVYPPPTPPSQNPTAVNDCCLEEEKMKEEEEALSSKSFSAFTPCSSYLWI